MAGGLGRSEMGVLSELHPKLYSCSQGPSWVLSGVAGKTRPGFYQ